MCFGCHGFGHMKQKYPTYLMSDVELDREELSTKFDEANQTIGVLRFENNFLVEKTKKLKVELVQVRVQLKRSSSAKRNDMLSIQKFALDRTGLGYGLLLILLLLVILFLYLLLILLKLRTMRLKLN